MFISNCSQVTIMGQLNLIFLIWAFKKENRTMYRNAEIKKEVKSSNIHPPHLGASEGYAHIPDDFPGVDIAGNTYNRNDASQIRAWLLVRLILQLIFFK